LRPFRRLIGYEDAMQRIYTSLPQLGEEEVPLDEAVFRVASRELRSSLDVPGFTRSAMDGYAVRSEDTFGAGKYSPVSLRCVGTSSVGRMPGRSIGPGECMEIATGAPLPDGADAVVMVEYTERSGDEVLIHTSVPPGENVSAAGCDIRNGDVLVAQGTVLTPPKIGMLAAAGKQTVPVRVRPRVGIASSGDEVVQLGDELEPGKVYDINRHTLSSLVRSCGGIPVYLGHAGDTVEEVRGVIERGRDCHITLISGGSSVGERDVVCRAVGEENILFHGVRIKPGKPTLCAVIRGQVVFGFPGHPTSCLSNAYLILRPVLMRMLGSQAVDVQVTAQLAARINSTIGRMQFFTVKLEKGLAVPAFKESGDISSMGAADGYILVPEDVDLLEKEMVTVHLFEGFPF